MRKILIALLCLVSCSVFGQRITDKLERVGFLELRANGPLHLPEDTVLSSSVNADVCQQIAKKNGVVYHYDCVKEYWAPVAPANALDSARLSNDTLYFHTFAGGEFAVKLPSTSTASNGLTKTLDDIQLGGTLVKPTTVDIYNTSFTFNGGPISNNRTTYQQTSSTINLNRYGLTDSLNFRLQTAQLSSYIRIPTATSTYVMQGGSHIFTTTHTAGAGRSNSIATSAGTNSISLNILPISGGTRSFQMDSMSFRFSHRVRIGGGSDDVSRMLQVNGPARFNDRVMGVDALTDEEFVTRRQVTDSLTARISIIPAPVTPTWQQVLAESNIATTTPVVSRDPALGAGLYGDANFEARSATYPAIGFHRPGNAGMALYLGDIDQADLRIRTSSNTDYKIWHDGYAPVPIQTLQQTTTVGNTTTIPIIVGSSGSGYVRLNGAVGATGWVGFYNPSDVRAGYIGSDPGSNMNYVAEGTAMHVFSALGGGTGTRVMGIGTSNVYNPISLPNNRYIGWNRADGTNDDAGIKADASNNLVFYTGAERVHIQSSTGNVGIGTSASTSKLDVAGDGHFTGNVTAGNAGNTSSYQHQVIRREGTTDYTASLGIYGESGSGWADLKSSNGTQDQSIYLPPTGGDPIFRRSDNATYLMWHNGNHMPGELRDVTFTGAQVPARIASNSSGHLTTVTTRNLTAADIGVNAGAFYSDGSFGLNASTSLVTVNGSAHDQIVLFQPSASGNAGRVIHIYNFSGMRYEIDGIGPISALAGVLLCNGSYWSFLPF